jgi:hypothetical protein
VKLFTPGWRNKTLQGDIQLADIHEILHAKWQGGEGDVFSQEKRIYCLNYIQNFVEKL